MDVVRNVAVRSDVERAPRVGEFRLKDEVPARRGIHRQRGDGERGVRVPSAKFLAAKVSLVPAAKVLRLFRLPSLLRIGQSHREPGRKVRLEVKRQQRSRGDGDAKPAHEVRVVGRVRTLERRGRLRGHLLKRGERNVRERAESPTSRAEGRERFAVRHDGVAVLVGFERSRRRRAGDEVRRLASAVVVHDGETRKGGHRGVRDFERGAHHGGGRALEHAAEPHGPVSGAHLRVGALRDGGRGELARLEQHGGLVHREFRARSNIRGEVKPGIDAELQDVTTPR